MGGHGRDRGGRGLDKSADKDKKGPSPKRRCSTRRTSSKARPPPGRPITFLFNGGPGSSSIWLHMGAFGPVRVRHGRREAQSTGAIFDRQQRPEPARRERPGVHRRARHRLLAHRRQGQGQGLLRGRPGHPRLHRFHHPVPDQIRPLELAQISVRRELWDDARGGAVARAAECRRRSERRDPAVGHLELGLHARRSAAQPGHRHAVRRRAADLCGDRLVFQQGRRTGPPTCAPSSLRSSSSRPAITRHALLKGNDAARRRAAADRAAAVRLHRPVGAVSPQDQPSHRIWRVPEGAVRRARS